MSLLPQQFISWAADYFHNISLESLINFNLRLYFRAEIRPTYVLDKHLDILPKMKIKQYLGSLLKLCQDGTYTLLTHQKSYILRTFKPEILQSICFEGL